MESEGQHGLRLGEMKVESGRLRRCSKYFETCLSERWAQSKSSLPRMEFYLEAQTDIMYYRDCFSRQLSFDSASDLSARLDELPLAEEDKQKKLSQCAMGMLSCYLRCAIPYDATSGLSTDPEGEASSTCPYSRKKFEGAFHEIVSGSGMCNDEVLQYALTLVKEETERLLNSLTDLLHNRRTQTVSFRWDISNLRWLLKMSRANAAQAIVEAIIKDREVQSEMYEFYVISEEKLEKRLRDVNIPMFEDVLRGRIFLGTPQRVTLFKDWNWHLKDISSDLDLEFVARLITTLPLLEQENFRMKQDFIDRVDCGPSTEVHTLWIRHLVSKTARQERGDEDISNGSSGH